MEQGCCVLCVCVCVCVCVYDRERERRTKRIILNNFMLALRPTYFHIFHFFFFRAEIWFALQAQVILSLCQTGYLLVYSMKLANLCVSKAMPSH